MQDRLAQTSCDKPAQMLTATTTDLKCAQNRAKVHIEAKHHSLYCKVGLFQISMKKQLMLPVTAKQWQNTAMVLQAKPLLELEHHVVLGFEAHARAHDVLEHSPLL
jgi:hypothetical protein